VFLLDASPPFPDGPPTGGLALSRFAIGFVLLGTCALFVTASRPAPESAQEQIEVKPFAVAASLGLGMGSFEPEAGSFLLLPTDPDAPPRVRVKPATGALDDETKQWLTELRPAGVILSLPLPDTRESLPVILPDDE